MKIVGNKLTKRQKKYCSYSCIFKSINKEKSINNWHIDISKRLHQIIEGSLMGDGSLEYSGGIDASPNFTVNQGGESLEYLQNLADEFKIDRNEIKFKKKYNKKTDKYTDSWCFRTRRASEFLPYLHRWYPNNGPKIVPKDFEITPLSLYHWYIGDGSFYQNAREIKLRLYTNGFTFDDVDWLRHQFLKFDIKFNLNQTRHKGYDKLYPILQTGAKSSIYNFFKVMPNNYISCYQYKFNAKF